MSEPNPKSFRLSRGLSLGVAAAALVAAAPDAGHGRHDGARMHHVAMHGGGMPAGAFADPVRR
jgi:hypothetical protein